MHSGGATQNDLRWMRIIDQNRLTSPNHACSVIPGRNALPRLVGNGFVKWSREQGCYVLTEAGKFAIGEVIDYQI